MLNIRIHEKQPITVSHKAVLSLFQRNLLEMCAAFLISRLLVWANRWSVSTWAIIFSSSSPLWAKPCYLCNLRGRTFNPTYSISPGWADHRKSSVLFSPNAPALRDPKAQVHICLVPLHCLITFPASAKLVMATRPQPKVGRTEILLSPRPRYTWEVIVGCF